MPLAIKNSRLILKDGKIAENCACCCRCLSPFCCNASDEMFATISRDSSVHTWEWAPGDPSKSGYIVNMELELESISGTYTLDNVSQPLPCGIDYENDFTYRFGDLPQDWPTIPEIRLNTFIRSPPQTSTVSIFFVSYQFAGKASYRVTGNIGGPREILNLPVILSGGDIVSAPAALGDIRSCERWSSLGVIPLSCRVQAYNNPYFSYYQSYIERGLLHDWSPPLTATVSVDV